MTVHPPPSPPPLHHGPMAAEISNAVVQLMRAHVGKGPTQARTIIDEDVVTTVLRGGFTVAERTLYKAGRADVVEHGRRAMQEVFEREMRQAIERVTGRRVDAFLSANHHEPDISVETFVLDGPPVAPVEENGEPSA